MREDYIVKVRESSKEMTARERIMAKNLESAVELATVTKSGAFLIPDVAGYVVLDIHNEAGKDKDYTKYVILGGDGTKYVTGSNSFWRNFIDIWTELKAECPDENVAIEVIRKPSRNNEGDFLTCGLI